jgi:23S rRNA (pseudouridine1915-N3)-methyltransferase
VKLALVAVGRAKGALADPIQEYEMRVRRYFSFEAVEVKETAATRGKTPGQVMEGEGERLLSRVPDGFELVALHREGDSWSSERLATYLAQLQLGAQPGLAFVIGGALGLAPAVLDRADRLLSLSSMTLPHELARLVLTEQLYRAGTILRGEPYHKATKV